MIITICGSIKFTKEMLEVNDILKQEGHKVLLPEMTERFNKGEFNLENFKDGRTDASFKQKYDLIRKHFKEVGKSDVILVLNYERKGIKNYIGGNTFAEITIAYYLNKPIYILNPIPEELNYAEEIKAMNPIILNGDLTKLRGQN